MRSREIIGAFALAVAIAFVTIMGIVVLITPPAEDQESIQEDELEVIHTQQIRLLCNMEVIHDNRRNVTCWTYEGGLACIPDHMLTP